MKNTKRNGRIATLAAAVVVAGVGMAQAALPGGYTFADGGLDLVDIALLVTGAIGCVGAWKGGKLLLKAMGFATRG